MSKTSTHPAALVEVASTKFWYSDAYAYLNGMSKSALIDIVLDLMAGDNNDVDLQAARDICRPRLLVRGDREPMHKVAACARHREELRGHWTPVEREFIPTTCEHCQRPVADGRFVELEMDSSTGLYHHPGAVPEDVSQGVFMVGAGCAKTLLRKSAAIKRDR